MVILDLSPTHNDISGVDVAEERLTAGKAALTAAMEREPRVFFPKTSIPKEGWKNKVCEIVSGWAVRRLGPPHARTPIISVLLPGDLIGVSELFSESFLDSIETRSVVAIRSIGYAGVLNLAAGNPDVAMWLLCCVNHQIAQYDKRLGLLARGNALEKVAMLLLELHRRFSRVRSSRGKEPVRVPLTQRDIADYSGLALEYVSRLLAGLQERGGVNVLYGAVEIVDPEILAESASVMAELWVDNLDRARPILER